MYVANLQNTQFRYLLLNWLVQFEDNLEKSGLRTKTLLIALLLLGQTI